MALFYADELLADGRGSVEAVCGINKETPRGHGAFADQLPSDSPPEGPSVLIQRRTPTRLRYPSKGEKEKGVSLNLPLF